MAIKEIKLQAQDKHGGRILSIPSDTLVAGDMFRMKDKNTIEAGSLADFIAEPIVGITETITGLDGEITEVESGVVTDYTASATTPIADGDHDLVVENVEALTISTVSGRMTAVSFTPA